MHLLFYTIFLLPICEAFASNPLNCFNCYVTGPFESKCTMETNCTGDACLLSLLKVEDSGSVSKYATCLSLERSVIEDGCWTEVQTGSKHCICTQNWCNTIAITKDDWGAVLENDPFPMKNSSKEHIETFTLQLLPSPKIVVAQQELQVVEDPITAELRINFAARIKNMGNTVILLVIFIGYLIH